MELSIQDFHPYLNKVGHVSFIMEAIDETSSVQFIRLPNLQLIYRQKLGYGDRVDFDSTRMKFRHLDRSNAIQLPQLPEVCPCCGDDLILDIDSSFSIHCDQCSGQ